MTTVTIDRLHPGADAEIPACRSFVMKYRLLMVSLFVFLPVLACAQETKLVNCRTLEAAGNFIGPDEVLDGNNMVCQKVKAGAAAPSNPQPLKPVPGVVISNTEPASVVEAAKESEKRVAAAREAAAAKGAAAPEPAATTPVQGSEPETPAPASVTPEKPAIAPVVSPPPASVPAAEPATTAPAPEKPETPAIVPVVPAPPAAKPKMVLPAKTPGSETARAPEPVQEEAPAASAPAPASASSESATTVQTAAAPDPAGTVKPAEPEVSAAPTPATAEAVPAAAPAPQEAATPAVEKANGFYDANNGTNVVTAAPSAESANTGFGGAQPANQPAESAPAAEPDARNTAAAAMAPPDDPNEERERVVQLGAFAKPREEAPDPEAEEHKTTFLPGDAEGFQEGQRPGCTKNITLGSLKGEKLVLGTPEWATKWIEKNQKHMPQVCFSDTPMRGGKNYLIVFYTPQGATTGAGPANTLLTSVKDTPASGMGTFTTSYGSTWHYSYDRTVGVTVLTRDEADEPHSQPGQVLYATAYSEEGVPVTQHWPEKAKKQVKLGSKKAKQIREAREVMEQVSSDLLEQMVSDIAGL